MQRDARAYLWDAVQAANSVRAFIRARNYEAFAEDDLVRSAVERQLQIVGEALAQLAKLDPQSAATVPDLPRIIAFRNILVHGYAGIDYETVWRLIQEKLPELISNLTAILDERGAP
ncbi:MAG TPA: HepT-like ribonuclease domain-containing protein [Stellaceae bacterium]|nr:HepT-like ribonuclease domain-containing protein [Stellaceae bacterium]